MFRCSLIASTLLRYRSHIRKLILYCVIGVCGVGIDAGVFFFLLHFPFWAKFYILANAVSVICGIINNFLLNAFFNFRKTDNLRQRFICFFLTGLLGMALGSAIIYGLVRGFCLSVSYAKLASIFIVTIVQFLLNYFVSFRDISKRTE